LFEMPPLEAAFHAAENDARHELYLMCDDITETLAELESKQVPVSPVTEQRWGKVAALTLPGGGKIGIYQPSHLSPLKQNR
jgi:hypothetical protein